MATMMSQTGSACTLDYIGISGKIFLIKQLINTYLYPDMAL